MTTCSFKCMAVSPNIIYYIATYFSLIKSAIFTPISFLSSISSHFISFSLLPIFILSFCISDLTCFSLVLEYLFGIYN